MKTNSFFRAIVLMMALGLALPGAAAAAVVGRLTQVEGRVDLLKGAKLPAIQMKVDDGVEKGDVLRTKTMSKAQITFMDNSVVTISPESRLAIEEYLYDAGQNKRNAVLQLFQGLAHIMVPKILQAEEPDFIIKTQTSVTGVRGSELGIRNHPNSTTSLQFDGKSRVNNVDPFVPGSVDLNKMQGTETFRNRPPTMAFDITKEDHQHFMKQMDVGLMGRKAAPAAVTTGTAATGGTTRAATPEAVSGDTSSTPGATVYGTSNTGITQVTSQIIVIPPQPPAPAPAPTPSHFSFTQQYYGAWVQLSDAPYSQSQLYTYSWGQRTGVYDGYFYALGEATRTSTSGANYFASSMNGTSTGTSTGTVTGFLGQTLTGTMTYTGTNSTGNTVNRTGTITIQPSGAATYNWTDTVTNPTGQQVATGVGSTTQTPGTYFSQSASGTTVSSSSAPFSTQTVVNSGLINGTRTGVSPGSFTASLSFFNSANPGTFGSGSSQVTFTSQGVVDTATGQGVMTNAGNAPGEPQSNSGGPVTLQSDGTLISPMVGGQYADPAKTNYVNSMGVAAQTSNPSAQPFTQTSWGSADLTTATGQPNATATFNGTSWGQRNLSGGPNAYTTGPMLGTLTDTSGGTITPGGVPIRMNQIIGGVVTDAGGGIISGVAQGIGNAQLNGFFTTQGTVTITGAGDLTYNNSGNWRDPSGRGTITGASMVQQLGNYFAQTATGQVTSTSAAPFQQQTTVNQNIIAGSRTGFLPGNFSINPANLTIISSSQTGVTNVFSPGPTNNTVILNSQGVVRATATPGVYSGAMTQWATTPTGGNLGAFNGPVTIQNTGNLSATNLTGPMRVLTPGGNRVPVNQLGVVTQTP